METFQTGKTMKLVLPQRDPLKKLVELHRHVPVKHSNPIVSSHGDKGQPEAPFHNLGTLNEKV